MSRGFALKEALLGLAVLVVAAGILLAIGFSMKRKDTDRSEAERLRRLYFAIAAYQESFSGEPPPSLNTVGAFLSDRSAYLSDGDPYASASGPYPLDGGKPKGPRTSSFRISFAYLWSFRPNLKWEQAFQMPATGFIADEWLGKVDSKGDFAAQVSGPVWRVNLDGSLFKTPDRASTALGNELDLFGPQK